MLSVMGQFLCMSDILVWLFLCLHLCLIICLLIFCLHVRVTNNKFCVIAIQNTYPKSSSIPFVSTISQKNVTAQFFNNLIHRQSKIRIYVAHAHYFTCFVWLISDEEGEEVLRQRGQHVAALPFVATEGPPGPKDPRLQFFMGKNKGEPQDFKFPGAPPKFFPGNQKYHGHPMRGNGGHQPKHCYPSGEL